jgi:hypothetical protein
MKIDKTESIFLDDIFRCKLEETENNGECLAIYTAHSSIAYTRFFDMKLGTGYCKNLKAKIDAYFEAKERMIMYNASLIGAKRECNITKTNNE